MDDRPPKFGQRSQCTWVSQAETPAIIKQFLVHYSRGHYSSLAHRAKELTEEELSKPEWHDVHVNIISRAKTPKSLEEKLKMRHTVHPYEHENDIWDDIHDLAGIRVMLYMASKDQREKVEKAIQNIWGEDVQRKNHEGSDERMKEPERTRILQTTSERQQLSTKKKYHPRHLGYIAVHYRAKMKESQGRNPYFYKSKDRVEIQVVSALSHAWAEAGHDVLYKSYAYGPPTLQEEVLLDAINGIVLSGDLLLEQFHELVMKRTFTPFRHRGDFNIFLRELDILQPSSDCNPDFCPDFEGEHVDVLLRFLKIIGKDHPLAVRNAFKELGFPDDPKLDTIMAQEIKPSFQPARGVAATVCLLRRLMPEREHDTPKKLSPRKQCYIMMNALILLQTFFGRAELTNNFLCESVVTSMSEAARESLNFVLNSSHRQLLWNKENNSTSYEDYEDIIRPNLKSAWEWFRAEADIPRSICGIAFRLAEIGATKDIEWTYMLSELKIGHILSRRSTSSIEDDAEDKI